MSATRSLSTALQNLGRTLAARDLVGVSDAELVGRFAERRDEAAFTALVRRYGRVVFGVCRRVLRHEQDAEDAFQAAFLVLARNAASVRRADAVGNWLYGVAYNVARKAKAMRHRRQVKEQTAAAQQRTDTAAVVADDWQDILEDEIHALPDRYRAALVLCDLRGLTIREAAAEVGCPQKTLGTRLSRGRSLLARRLTRRGVTLSAGALTAALVPCATAASVSRLVGPTVHAALGLAAVSPTVAALTQGVTNVMLPRFLKYVVVLACGFLTLTGVAAGTHAGLFGKPSEPADLAAAPAARPAEGAAPAKVKPARAPSHVDQMHRKVHNLLVLLVTPFGIGPNQFVSFEEKKDDKAKSALTGTWGRKGGEEKIEFSDKNVMKISAHNGDLIVNCEYSTGKDGLVKAKITGLDGKEELKEKAKDKLPIGFEFNFKWKVKDSLATLDDLKGENAELLKAHLEGDYENKGDK